MTRFTLFMLFIQGSVTLLGVVLILTLDGGYEQDYLKEEDLDGMGFPVKKFRSDLRHPLGQMEFRAWADAKGVPVFLFADVRVGTEREDYERYLHFEQKRNKRNANVPGYHRLSPLRFTDMEGFILRMHIQTNPKSGHYTVITEAHGFDRGKWLIVRVTQTEVARADLKMVDRLSEGWVMRVFLLIRERM